MLRGIVGILFGVLTLLRPGLTIASFVRRPRLAAAFRPDATGPRSALALGGLASLIAGFLIVVQPGLGWVVLLYALSAWAMVSGAARRSPPRWRCILSNRDSQKRSRNIATLRPAWRSASCADAGSPGACAAPGWCAWSA